MAPRQAMATPLGRSPITQAAITANRTMAVVTGMVIMTTMTDRPDFCVGENDDGLAHELFR